LTQSTPDPHEASRRPNAGAGLERALQRAGWAILWERAWPKLAGLLTAIGLFLAVSWLGLWLWLPPIGRGLGLFIFFVLLFPPFVIALALVRFPSREERLRRLDGVSGLAHRPATTIADTMATPESDGWAKALWRAHVEQALARLRDLRAGWPVPQLASHDPYAVRAFVLILLVATFVAADGERGRRIAAAFDWQGVVLPPNFRLDAWVSPPNYTAKPPVILPGLRPGEPAPTEAAAVSVPVGSVLIIRASGQTQFDVAVKGGLKEVTGDQRPQAPAGTEERRYTIAERGTATLSGIGSDDIVWAFNAIPDRPPTISLTKDPEPQARGALALSYKVEDDYGVSEAHANFALKDAASAPRPLYGPPDFALALPQARTRNGVGQTTKDLTEHPWAGAEVNLTLSAKDDAGNEGRSEAYALRLPQRPFVKPLPRALIEQRRDLALDADSRDRVLIALDALATAPELFSPETSVYLGLRSIYWSLAQAKSDDDLRGVVARLWQMATQIEDGNVSDAEAALRQAQENLRQALERGASDEEIKKLMQDLRAALDKFLQALAEEMRKNPQMAQRPTDPNMRELNRRDLQSMIDRMERLARSGAKDAARALLDQMQQMLENLQMARPGQMNDDDDMMSSLDELGNMIREQQQLRDKTFRQGQDQRSRQRSQQGQRGQPGQRGQQGQQQQGEQGQQGDQNGFGDLQQNQQALRDRLNKLMEQLKQKGFGQQPGEQNQGGDNLGQLDDAGSAMGDAQDSLGEGNADGAVDSQGRALDALRKGAQNLAQQMQEQMGQGPGQPGSRGQARAQPDTDPLNRPMHRGHEYDDSTVKVPGEMDVQRARRILEELRRRFGESMRPQLELDYLERLLKDY
jgi:uncharacterized protein (TIGR02302 family)